MRCNNIAGVRGLSARLGGSNLTNVSYHIVPNPPQYPQGLVGNDADWWLAVEYNFDGG